VSVVHDSSPGLALAVYPVIAEPPSLEGGFQERSTWEPSGLTLAIVRPLGANGAPRTVAGGPSPGLEGPMALAATTSKL
jgi:hypothetical protein